MQEINQNAFKEWLKDNYPNLSNNRINSIVSAAFYIESKPLGITLDQILSGEKSRTDYLSAVEDYLLKNNKAVHTLSYVVAANMKYLLRYLNVLYPNTYNLESWSLEKGKRKVIGKEKEKREKQSTLSINEAVEAIKRFHARNIEGEFTRYRSWAHCYKIFNELWNDKTALDLLSLHLSWYLASWGMLRGSAFLMKFDYKIHYSVIKQLTEPAFAPLYLEPETPHFELVKKAKEIIEEGYGNYKPSQTLVTKILLGIFGCTPAYDRYFIESAKKYNLTTGKFSIHSLRHVWAYYEEHKEVLENLREELEIEGIKYPPMKLMDMALFQLGIETTNNEKI